MPTKLKYACLIVIMTIGVGVGAAACISPKVRNVLLRACRREPLKGPPLVFPPAANLSSAFFIAGPCQCEKRDLGWRPVSLEDARKLVTAMSDNYKYLRPSEFRGCALWRCPDWYFRLAWDDGTKMTLPLTYDGRCILELELTEKGSSLAQDGATYMVNGGAQNDLVSRCVGEGPPPALEKKPDQVEPK